MPPSGNTRDRFWKTALLRRTLPLSRQQFASERLIANTRRYEWETDNSRATRGKAQLQRLASGSGVADADEQCRSGSGGSAGSIDLLRRVGVGRANLGV